MPFSLLPRIVVLNTAATFNPFNALHFLDNIGMFVIVADRLEAKKVVLLGRIGKSTVSSEKLQEDVSRLAAEQIGTVFPRQAP
jgi:hypothetical protein